MYIKREDAIKAIVEYFSDGDDSHWNAIATYIIKDISSAEKQDENATRCYEFLKTKLGESIVDSKKEFESWYERMVWHVKECDKLAREPKQGEWIPCSEKLPTLNEDGVSDMVLLCWSDGQRTVGAYQGNRTFVGQAWPVARDCRVTVIAWMPLPDPMKGADDEVD